ncbi:MAG: LUD domain-containing protein [Arenicellales bacterium]|jgi:L-lactate dehydrogenase complex protein LldG|nr:lactate utilization protein C [Pseudomonadota bacterium]MDP7490881.1 LUD domain-containing protein [Arenicellales bacterium]MEE1558591.1 LUD domain-containing protein [Arenicellales bacterium]HCV20226.1 lactate utilization protein C [Gammaproteobacteria bacterium]|tara:strand:- start:1769 stop:2458 length:690 start_codon:yes stop_codon:yes gene_type:complete
MARHTEAAMSSARKETLEAIRTALVGSEPRTSEHLQELKARIQESVPHLQPQLDGDLLTHFCEKHIAVHGTYERVGRAGVATAVLRHLDSLGIPRELLVGAGPILDQVQWPEQVVVERRSANKDDCVALSEAFAGIAESGTVVLLPGAGRPSSHNFLPEDHIIVVDCARIVRHQEDAWTLVRALPGRAARTIQLITGPSKTGDIEQAIQYGAHGPRRVHLVIVEDRDDA